MKAIRLLALSLASALILMPSSALADDGVPIQAAFTVTATSMPNTGGVTYCGGPALPLTVEAKGSGFSSLGALSLSLQKTISVPGAMHGCLTLTAPNGDTLYATYDGNEDVPDAHGFISATGTLIFTGGTGRFQGGSGTATFTGTFLGLYPQSSFIGGTSSPLQVSAYYVIQGRISLRGGD